MREFVLTIFLLCVLALGSSFPDPVSQTFLTVLKEAAFQSKANNKQEIGIINQLRNLDLNQVISKKSDNLRSGELDHQVSGPRPEVLVKNGRVTGETIAGSHAFYSVPYGKPPVGSLRFMPPEPAEDFLELNASLPNYRMCWQIKDCDENEPNCRDPMSEDCLVLNVNVPANIDLSDASAPPSERLPVLVWFHGGFFFRGRATTTKYDGRWLSAAINAIVVTVNYRIGPLGFLTFEDELGYVEGNQGLKDQQLALQWIQDNIETFGGNKDKVTLFANSAGSQAVYFHLVSATSDPLFHRAITQSAPAVIRHQTSEESMQSVTSKVMDAIGCPAINFTCPWTLRTVDAETLTYSRNSVMVDLLLERDLFGAIEPFRPVIDGIEFTDQPLNLFKNGKWQNHKELMIGTNQEEMAQISAFFEYLGFPLPKAIFEAINNLVLGKTNGEKVNDMYEENFDFDLSDNLAAELTDLVFVCPNRAFARHAARTTTHPSKRVYFYNNAYPLSDENCQLIEDVPTLCGNSYHSTEQMFVFKSFEGYETGFTPEDSLVSDMFSTYWGGFANNGDPSSGLDISLGDFTLWPVYEEASSPAWINIQLDYPNSLYQAGLREKQCDLWEDIGYATSFN